MVLAVVVIGGLVGLGRARRHGRPRAAAQRVRRGRRRVARDPRAGHRPGPRHAERARGRQDRRRSTTMRGLTMGHRRRYGALAVTLALALGVAACGEEKEEPAATRAARRGDRELDTGRGLRQGHDQRERVGRLDGERLHRQGGARGQPRLRGRDHQDRGDPGLPGHGRRQGRRGARGLAARRRVREVHRGGRHRRRRRPARRRGPHRLVHPEVPDGRAPRVRDVGGPEGPGGAVQDRRVRRPGHVPRRRPVLRAEGQGAHRGARASTSST